MEKMENWARTYAPREGGSPETSGVPMHREISLIGGPKGELQSLGKLGKAGP